MEDELKKCLWKNFGAAIDMLDNAIAMYPKDLWLAESKFFYLAYHTLIFLDYYLTIPARDFQPALPYTLVEGDQLPSAAVDDVIPDRHYTQQEMLAYLSSVRSKCKMLILSWPANRLSEPWINEADIPLHGLCPSTVKHYSVLEILFYNFRHVQHHVGQLNMLLRQQTDAAPDWVSHAD